MSSQTVVFGDPIQTTNPTETFQLAVAFASCLSPGNLVALHGDLGAGKTVFAQGIGEGLELVNRDGVRSPTFAIFDVHEGRHRLVHVDLYRIEEPQEIEALGILDLLDDGVVVVEWFERSGGLLGKPDFVITLAHAKDNPEQRDIVITAG